MLSNLSNNNSGNPTKNVVEKKHYEDIEKRLDELQDEIDSNTDSISQNAQDISGLDDRVGAVENNSTFPTLNTDTINPATGNGIDVTGNVDVDGGITADFADFGELSVNGTNFTTVKDDAAQAKSTAESAKNKADEAYDLADALSDELADYKSDNEQSFTTGTLNADSVIADSVAVRTINTNNFETTNAEIDKLYVDTIKATGFLELPTSGQSYYTVTIPAKTTASFSGVYTSTNNTDYPYYFTVSDGAVIYKQGSTEIIKDISFDRETGYTKVRLKSSTSITYISSALDDNPVTIEDGGDAYADYAFIPQKTGGYLVRGYDDTTTEVYIAGVLKAYAMSIEEEIIERTSVDFLKVNASIELPKEWDAGGTISYSTGEENEYISAQKKAGAIKPTWTSPIHSTIGSLSYSYKLVDEATVASYKGIAETRQTQTISITDEASLQQLTAFHWTKNGNYWQPYEITRITIGDQTMWIDPVESNQGIRLNNNQVIADGTWDDVPVEESNAVPVNLVIFDAPTEISYPITNLGDQTIVHGEIEATCFKGNVLGNVTGNADTATNATCFDNKTYAQACTDILSGCAADSNMFNGKTYSEVCADILSGTATQAHCVDIDNLTTNSYPLVMESATCELGKSGTCPITFTPSSGILETNQVSTSCIENSGTTQSQCLCATCDINVDGDAYITGDLTVQGTITTTHSEEVVTPSENIILRDGATTPIASGCFSGMTITNYDGQNNNLEVGADKDGTLHVGVVGATMEPIATRATEACMEDGFVIHWNSNGTDLVTKGATNTHDLNVNGNASVTGTLTADLAGTADNATCFNGKEASCYIDTSSTAQTKAGNLCIGAPTACTATSAGDNGLLMCALGTIELYKEGTPYIDFHHNRYCGDYSSRISSSYISSECRGSLDLTVNNGIGCTTCTECTNYCFKSDGTFSGASTICASTNVYSAGCPVVTTGNIATVAPGYNCTGTSNYVVTTMVCCAKYVCRNIAASGTCHLALFSDNTASASSSVHVSNVCPLTYEPATGVLTAACFAGNASTASGTSAYNNYCMDSYTSNADYSMVLSAGAKCLGRSGSCSVSFNPSTGVLKASTFCGSLSGNATTATGTSNYNCYCLDYYTGSMDRPIVISGTDSTTQSTVVTSLGRSTCCPLTFNPNTGVLRSAIFCGNLSGNATGTSSYDHYCLSYFCGNADRQVVLSDANTTPAGTVTNLGRSTNCLLTFNAGNGVMCRYGSCMFGYGIMLPSANGGTTYALIDNGSASGNVIEGRAYTNAFAIAKNCAGAANCIYRHGVDNYGTPAIGHISNTSTCFWLRYGAWMGPELFAKNPIKLVCTTTTAPSGITFCNSISEAASAVCATDATCAQYHCRIGYTDNYNFDVGLQNGIDCRTDYTYVSACCRLRYRSTTGNLCITQSNGTTVAGIVTAANGCFTNTLTANCIEATNVTFNGELYNTCCSTAIGYSNINRLPGSLTIGYKASSNVCSGVTWTSTIDVDHSVYGRHGRVIVTIPSCNVTCDTYNGLRHIINCVINEGACNCTWSIYSTGRVPTAKFAVYGYWWDDGGSADGYKRYSPGANSMGSITSPGYIDMGSAACSNLSINQLLYSCCCGICILGVGRYSITDTDIWVCGAHLEIVF